MDDPRRDISNAPEGHVPFEFSVLSQSSNSLPRDSERYIQFVERDAGTLVFNPTTDEDKPIATRHITLSGIDLKLGPDGDAPMFKRLSGQLNIRELVICADHLIISGELKLPGTKLSIWARKLTFVGNAYISTEPVPFKGQSRSTQAWDGQAGGSIHLYVREIEAPGTLKRFNTSGAAGQAAREGIPGDKAVSVTPWDGIIRDTPTSWWGQETLSWAQDIKGNPHTEGHDPVIVHWWQLVYVEARAGSTEHGWLRNREEPQVIGSTWPTDGPAPKELPGAPGLGGAGGDIHSHHAALLGPISEQKLGETGRSANDMPENPAGTPTKSCKVEVAYRSYWPFPHFEAGKNGHGNLNERERRPRVVEKRTTKPYPKVLAPPPGMYPARSGKQLALRSSAPWFWIHGLTLSTLAAYARDAFRVGQPNVARPLLQKYLDALDGYEDPKNKYRRPEDASHLEVDFVLFRAELMDLAQRMDGPNDYFGHPAGWVPGLSFQTNMEAYKKQVRGAIARLYLSYWMENNQAEKQQRIASTEQAIAKLQEEIEQAASDQTKAIKQLEELAEEERNLAAQIRTFLLDLETLEGELRRAAEYSAEIEHGLRTAAKILGGVAQLIPVGQPALGAVGQGFSALGNWEGEGAASAIKTAAAAVWDSKLVSDKLLPKAKQLGSRLLTKFLTTSDSDKEEIDDDIILIRDDETSDDDEGTSDDDKEKSEGKSKKELEFDKELTKQKLSAKVKKHIARQSDAKDDVLGALGNLSVSAEEVEAAVQKAFANCPEYEKLRAKLVELNAKKATYREGLAAAAHAVDAATTTLATSRLTQISLQAGISDAAALLSPEGLRYTRAMGERALQRLQQFQYYFAASYVYVNLGPLEDFDGNSEFMFDQLRKKLTANKTDVLTGDDFDRLYVVFEENIATVAHAILTYHNETLPQRDSVTQAVTSQLTLELSEEQLAVLNSGDNTIDIDPMAMGKLALSEEDVRIYNIVVSGIELLDPPTTSVDVRVRVYHDGTSVLWYGKDQFQFRGPSAMWGATINSAKGSSVVQERRSPDELSLIQSLTNQKSSEHLFPRLSAWARLRVETKLMDNVTEYKPKLKALRLLLQYTSRESSKSQRSLFVSVADGIRPRITLSAPDMSGRQDGQGSFLRRYRANNEVTLTAQPRFGNFIFQGWRMQGVSGDFNMTRPVGLHAPGTAGYQGDMANLITGQSITVKLDKDRFIRAIYILPAGGGSGADAPS